MKKLMAAVLGLAIVASSGAAFAQADDQDLGLFFDAAGTMTTTTATPFVGFNAYIVCFNQGDISAWEAGLTVPATYFVLNKIYSEPGALDIGTPGNYIVGLGTCATYSGATPLLTLNLLAQVADETTLCITPTTPSSVGGTGAAYVDCNDGLFIFGVAQNGGADYPNGCGVVNPTGEAPVATESSSMGALKASF